MPIDSLRDVLRKRKRWSAYLLTFDSSEALGALLEVEDELDLEGVPPTSHVVEVTGALRPDEPRPSLPREVAFANAPDIADDGFRVPSPQAHA